MTVIIKWLQKFRKPFWDARYDAREQSIFHGFKPESDVDDAIIEWFKKTHTMNLSKLSRKKTKVNKRRKPHKVDMTTLTNLK